jgi:hypothetical protein
VKVSGGADGGVNFFVQTITCRDCRELYDAVTRVRVPDEAEGGVRRQAWGLPRPKARRRPRGFNGPPSFQWVLGCLPYSGVRRLKWLHFKPQCPVSPVHSVQGWNQPGKCPRCGIVLEKNAVPYRIWE